MPRNHISVGEELKEISEAYLDERMNEEQCRAAWVCAILGSTLFGPTEVPKKQIKELAEFFSKWQGSEPNTVFERERLIKESLKAKRM